MTCDLTNPAFTDEDKAREFLRGFTLAGWPRLPVLRPVGYGQAAWREVNGSGMVLLQ